MLTKKLVARFGESEYYRPAVAKAVASGNQPKLYVGRYIVHHARTGSILITTTDGVVTSAGCRRMSVENRRNVDNWFAFRRLQSSRLPLHLTHGRLSDTICGVLSNNWACMQNHSFANRTSSLFCATLTFFIVIVIIRAIKSQKNRNRSQQAGPRPLEQAPVSHSVPRATRHAKWTSQSGSSVSDFVGLACMTPNIPRTSKKVLQ